MIKTMIVPTDGSDHAGKAVALAADLAAKYGARLIILHALLQTETPSGLRDLCDRFDAPADVVDRLNAQSENIVTTLGSAYAEVPTILPISKDLLEAIGRIVCEAAQSTAREHGVENVSTDIVDGAPADAILAAAKHENADMIVMGSRGLGRLEGLLVGAVSQRVNHHATCTCVTVK